MKHRNYFCACDDDGRCDILNYYTHSVVIVGRKNHLPNHNFLQKKLFFIIYRLLLFKHRNNETEEKKTLCLFGW